MQVSCPGCGAVYEVPDSVLASGGRRLRCASCATEWAPSVGAAVLPPPNLPEPEAPEGHPEDPEPQLPMLVATPPLVQVRPEQRSDTALVAASWGASIVALAAFALAAYLFRGAVQSAWPPSQVLYAALGLK